MAFLEVDPSAATSTAAGVERERGVTLLFQVRAMGAGAPHCSPSIVGVHLDILGTLHFVASQVQDGPAPSAFAYRTADCAGVPTSVLQRARLASWARMDQLVADTIHVAIRPSTILSAPLAVGRRMLAR